MKRCLLRSGYSDDDTLRLITSELSVAKAHLYTEGKKLSNRKKNMKKAKPPKSPANDETETGNDNSDGLEAYEAIDRRVMKENRRGLTRGRELDGEIRAKQVALVRKQREIERRTRRATTDHYGLTSEAPGGMEQLLFEAGGSGDAIGGSRKGK